MNHTPTQNSTALLHVGTGFILLLLGFAAISVAQKTKDPLPVVLTASVPVYPPTARIAGIEGIVSLRLSTNGKAITEVHIESGQPMLASAAEENIRTWELKVHKPTTFEARFQYRLEPEWECDMGNSVVVLRFPTEVEVSAKRIQTCDPAVQTPR